MRRSYLVALIMTLIVSGVTFYYTYTPICLVPLTYTLGTLDVRFNLTPEEAKAHLVTAEKVWEEASGQDLFVYDEKSSFPINFIFDDRQERTIAEEAERASLDEKQTTSAEIGAQYKKLTEEYAVLKTAFEKDAAAYDAALEAFNTKVAHYNDAGGAPPAEFAKLKIEEKKLANAADKLQERTNTLATLATEINEVSERGNRLIEQYNAGVAEYNHSFAAPNEFTQGDYEGENINIYKFSSENELLRVLTHEFGHALGVGHVEGEASIMYYLMEKQPEVPVLSTEDVAAFTAVCSERNATINGLYKIIRSLIPFTH